MRVAAKWLAMGAISFLGIMVELAWGYSYPAMPAYPKRMLQTEAMSLPSQLTTSPAPPASPWEQSLAPNSALDNIALPITEPAQQQQQLPPEAEFLDQLDKLQFFKGQQTLHKRSWPIPQLQCKEGCDTYESSMVQCTNAKSLDQDIAKWRCEADLPRHLKFQKTTINCEGFESEEDNKILRGSCGLEYSLTNSGLKPIAGRVHRHYYTVQPNQDDKMRGWTASWLVVIGVIVYLINHNWTSFKSPVEEMEGLRAKVVTAHQAWKKEATQSPK